MKNQKVSNLKKTTDAKYSKVYATGTLKVQHLFYELLIKNSISLFLLSLSIIVVSGCKNINKDFAEAYSKSDTIQMLTMLKAGANINTHNENLETPLHIECKKCIQLEKIYFELKKSQIMLPEDNLAPDIKEADQKWAENIKMIAFLLDNKADIDIKNANGKSPFDLVNESSSKFCLGLLSGYKLNKLLDKNKKENK